MTDANDIWVSSGHVSIPQPFDAAAWNASLAGRAGPRVDVHRPPVLRHQLRDGRGGSRLRHLGGVRGGPQHCRADGAGRGAAAGLSQPQLGVLPARRQPGDDRVRPPHRGDRPPRGPLRDGPVLGDTGRAGPGRPPSPTARASEAVPREGHEPGRQLRGPGHRASSTSRGSSGAPGTSRSTSSSATMRARRRVLRPTLSTPRGWASSTWPACASRNGFPAGRCVRRAAQVRCPPRPAAPPWPGRLPPGRGCVAGWPAGTSTSTS